MPGLYSDEQAAGIVKAFGGTLFPELSSPREQTRVLAVGQVRAGGYENIVTSGSLNSGTAREYFGMNSRAAFFGPCSVRSFSMYMNSQATSLTSFKLRLWRENAAGLWDMYYESPELGALVSNSSTFTYEFARPIDVQEQDRWSLLVTAASSVTFGTAVATSGVNGTVWDTTVGGATTDRDWQSFVGGAQSSAAVVPITFATDDPWAAVLFGDSIPSGVPLYETPATSTITSTKRAYWTAPHRMFARSLGIKVANVSIGSQTSTMLAARYATDLAKLGSPRWVVTDYGELNDVQNSVSDATTLSNLDTMISACQSIGAKLIIFGKLPWTAGTNTQMQTLDTKAEAVRAHVAGMTDVFFVDVRSTLGQNRPTGDSGNLWDIKTAYNSGDNIHYNEAGSRAWVQKVIDEVFAVNP